MRASVLRQSSGPHFHIGWPGMASSLAALQLLVNRALSLPRHRANNPSNIQNEVGKMRYGIRGVEGGSRKAGDYCDWRNASMVGVKTGMQLV